MKNLNKVLAMLVVFMMVVSTVAFAAFTDVADTSSYATAIDVDVDLGIIKGYDDNTFRPEGEITRAEFAAIVVRLLGQEAQSAGAAASTQFADVPASHWAAGYINIAVQAGVINGYGNGNFGPDDLVAYQDALTMMVRALGYEPAIGSAGYPTGYLTKAGDLGLTKNVNGTNGVPANRGTIAQIAFNALDVPLMTQTGYGTFTQYVINDGYSSTSGYTNYKKTLLSENHRTVKVQGVILSSTDATSSSVTGTDK
ncbi:MAG: S-layer homology domain-containing protein, partial [Clostridia bacterium]|nr:S-layer homology domain-containing protein [Clostridia bacterium]